MTRTYANYIEEQQGATAFEIAIAIAALNPDIEITKTHQEKLKIKPCRLSTKEAIDRHLEGFEDKAIEDGDYKMYGVDFTAPAKAQRPNSHQGNRIGGAKFWGTTGRYRMGES